MMKGLSTLSVLHPGKTMANPDPSSAPLETNLEPTSANAIPNTADSEVIDSSPQQGSRARQLLGMKGAQTGDTNIWKIRLQLMKPITWVPLVWGVICGAAASGHFTWTLEHVLMSATCMLMSGPLLTGYTQTINDL